MENKRNSLDDAIAELKAMEEADRPYYKLYMYNTTNLIGVVCLQWFDEYDYDEHRFVKNREKDTVATFDTEQEAIAWLNSHIKEERIDPDYRIVRDDYYK